MRSWVVQYRSRKGQKNEFKPKARKSRKTTVSVDVNTCCLQPWASLCISNSQKEKTVKSRLLTTIAAVWFGFSAVSISRSANMGTSTSDWPQWRGPQRDGTSQESGLLKQWPAGGPKLLWQGHDIGDGYSTPAVVGTRIYLMSNRGMENEFVQALSTQDGTPVWTTRVGN